MKLKRYFTAGVLFSIGAPALLNAYATVTRDTFESWPAFLVIPGFIPFGSSDPEAEMSWFSFTLALGLNAIIFGGLGVVLGWLLNRGAQQGIQPDGPASGGSAS